VAAEKRFEPWPVALACMLAFMIAVSLGFYAVAAHNIDAEVVEDSYTAGLRYNDELAARRRVTERGVRIAFEATPTADGVAVEVRLVDAAGKPLRADAAALRRERPTQGGFDGDFALARAGEGWRGDVPLPLPGRWRLVTTLVVDGDPVQHRVDLERKR
jgi:nitrogen fixation protein FixH